MWRVFMCTAGTSGDCMWATRLMPLAQNRPRSAAPGICLRNSSENAPCTVEMFTPTFSNTRPRITDITPPPPSAPSSVGRRHSVRSKRPGGLSLNVPSSSFSSRSNSAQMRSLNSANHSAALAFSSSVGTGIGDKRSESVGLTQGLTQHHRGADCNVERAQARLHGNDEAGIGCFMHLGRRPTRFAAEHQGVGGCIGKVDICRVTLGRQQDEATRALAAGAPDPARVPGRVAGEVDGVEIVHAGAAQPPIVEGKAAGLDDIDGHTHAGAQPQYCAGILGDVGFEECESHEAGGRLAQALCKCLFFNYTAGRQKGGWVVFPRRYVADWRGVGFNAGVISGIFRLAGRGGWPAN